MHREDIKIVTWGFLFFLFIATLCLNHHQRQIPLKLKTICLSRIEEAGGKTLEIEIRGRDVRVTGTVPDARNRTRLLEDLRKIPGIRNLNMSFTIDADSLKMMALRRLAGRTFLFTRDSPEPLASSLGLLDSLKMVLDTYPEIHIRFEGWTDQEGDPVYNQILSEKRAAGIRDALVLKGCDGARLYFTGCGETSPDSTAVPDSLARRVDFIFEE